MAYPSAGRQKRKKRRGRKLVSQRNRCRFTPKGQDSPNRETLKPLDYKNIDLLLKFTSAQGKLFSRKRSGNSQKAQARLKQALKISRYMALLPYTGEQ